MEANGAKSKKALASKANRSIVASSAPASLVSPLFVVRSLRPKCCRMLLGEKGGEGGEGGMVDITKVDVREQRLIEAQIRREAEQQRKRRKGAPAAGPGHDLRAYFGKAS